MNIAILFLHHASSTGDIRGWKCALDDIYFTLRLQRNDDSSNDDSEDSDNYNHTLADPLTLTCQPSRSGVEKIAPIEVVFDKKWSVYYAEKGQNTDEFKKQRQKDKLKQIVEYYRHCGFDHQAIYTMLGIGKETYNKWKNR